MTSSTKERKLSDIMIYDSKRNGFVINRKPKKIENKVISATLIEQSIIYSVRGRKIYRIKLDQGKKKEGKLIFSGEGNPDFVGEFNQIKTDYVDLNSFYACSNSKIIKFSIGKNEEDTDSEIIYSDNFDKYAISANYIATQTSINNDRYKISAFLKEQKSKVMELLVTFQPKIYVDNIFLYIFDKCIQTVYIYPLDRPCETPYKIIRSVVQITEGDKIGIQKSTMEIEIMGFKPVSFTDQYLPLYSYLYKNYLYHLQGSLYSIINTIRVHKQVIPFRTEENVYFDNINYFYFQRDLKNVISCSKELSNNLKYSKNKDYHFLSQIMLQRDYFIVSANKSILCYNKTIDSSEFNCEILIEKMNAPLYSLVSDLKQPFCFYGLTDKGILNHYEITQKNKKSEFEYHTIRKDVFDFCSSYNYISMLTYYETIHVINRNNKIETVISREELIFDNLTISKIFNDDTFLYVLYIDNAGDKICHMYPIDNLESGFTELQNVNHIWRTSNNGMICIQQKNKIIVDDHIHESKEITKSIKGVAYSRGSLCYWTNVQLQPKTFHFYSDNSTVTFYNGSCCFFFSPKHETFVLKFNDDSGFYSKRIENWNHNPSKNGKVSGTISEALSATVIGLNTIVFSMEAGLKLLFVSKDEPSYHFYSVNFEINKPKLTCLTPHPKYMNSFFGLSESKLYLFKFENGCIEDPTDCIASDVVSYSVSKDYLLLQFNEDSEIVQTSPNNSTVFIYKFIDNKITIDNFECSLPSASKESLIKYSIDDDYVYAFKHSNYYSSQDTSTLSNSKVTLYRLDTEQQSLQKVKTYKNVLDVIDSFQTLIILIENRLVFKNEVYHYQSDTNKKQVSTLFAACQDELMVWDTFIHEGVFNSNDPVIYKQPTKLAPLINCWYDGKNSLLFKRGEVNFLLGDNLTKLNNPHLIRNIIPLHNRHYLFISSETFIVRKINSDDRVVKNVGLLASADTYRSDPSDPSRFFAHFVQRRQLFIIQFIGEFRSRFYFHDVVRYDVSRNFIVIVNGEGKISCLEREGGIPKPIEWSNIDEVLNNTIDEEGEDINNILPFVDNACVYLLNTKEKKIDLFAICERSIKIRTIEKVVNVWSTDGVVIQTKDEENELFRLHINNIVFKTKEYQRVFAAAVHDHFLCVWMNEDENDDLNQFKNIKPFTTDLDQFNDDLKIRDNINEKLEDFKMRMENIIKDMMDQKDTINARVKEIENKFKKLKGNATMSELANMDDEEFINMVKDKNFAKNYVIFSRTPAMMLLIFAKKMIHIINEREDERTNNLELWISNLYNVLSIIPVDGITETASKPFLKGFQEKIPEYLDLVETMDIKGKKQLSKKLLHIDVILSSFSIE